MLGRLAKGVGGLAKGVAGVALGEARAALTAVANDESEVEALLQRISGSLLPEYRRQAMTQLKDLLVDNPKAQLALGNMGLPVLISVLRDERDDLELLRGALEALLAATSSSHGTGAGAGAAGGGAEAVGGGGLAEHNGLSAAEAHAAALNAELLARQRESVGLLLGLLEDEPVGVPDFYVRYHTVQLLTALLQHCAGRLQASGGGGPGEAVLATPMSVVRLTELLGERSEVIRNEALLLLAALTRPTGSPGGGGGGSEVQKIAAFEGAFDRISELLREEGGLDGGMVVQDCIELMNNLLMGNMANQRLFREMGHAANLPRLLAAAVPAAAGGGAPSRNASTPSSARASGMVGQFAQALGPIPFLSGGGGSGPFDGAADGLGADGEPSLELHNALSALAAAGSDALLGPPSLPPQKAANVLGLLETIRLLVGLLEPAALGALGDLVDGQHAATERLAAATVRPPPPGSDGEAAAPPPPAGDVPVLQAALRVALHAADGAERAAAEHVIACYCRGNPDGQAALAAAMGPPPQQPAAAPTAPSQIYGSAFGQELAVALLAGSGGSAAAMANGRGGGTGAGAGASAGLVLCVRATGVLQHVLCGSAAAKQRLLAAPLEGPGGPGGQPDFLMPRLVRQLTSALRPPCADPPLARLLVCSLLRLLLLWLHDCPPAVAALLDGAAHVPLLVDLVTGRQGLPEAAMAAAAGASPPTASTSGGGAASGDGVDPVVSGLAACVLGACILYGKSPPASAPTAAPLSELVLDVVLSRVGLAHFLFRLDDLRRSPAFAAAAAAGGTAAVAKPPAPRGGGAATPPQPAAAAGEGAAFLAAARCSI
ncbi:hypothetical protein GPECTOR_10g1079 [Gonium pectorale]|uniref:Vesicle tethering protein Uso1/P115-like head domain-containing protein n=1 Tax=Gonium pectorale TaxID=33097 RepID=A0A150GQB3_GONPE|nr:hypothetical protein GPECTOR_10g1079 [Gonium pectorale]|eukprot:KXZ52056.1 hypothetical protein GPECTOR_10g1079 [Gonium pectorale]